MLGEVLDQVFGFRRPRFPLFTASLEILETERPTLLGFTLMSCDGRPFLPLVKEGDQVQPGAFLGDDAGKKAVVCPVKGKVVGVAGVSDLRGNGIASTVLIEPDANSDPAVFSKLNPDKDPIDKLWTRIKEAGIMTDSTCPRPLSAVVGPDSGIKLETLIVLAADREPESASALALFRERMEDAGKAAILLGRMTGASRVALAAPDFLSGQASKVAGVNEVLALRPWYPESLEPMVISRAKGGENSRVVALETALAALDAVRDGKVQTSKLITFIGPGGKARAVYRAHLGTRLKDLFAKAGLSPRDRDKVVAGGPLRGFAQYTLDTPIDQGVDAFMLVPRESIIAWSDEPCISCGSCSMVCPVKLQPCLIGRYAEFGLFDRAEDYAVQNCIECGLCAAVCTARRPLVQLIRLAKRQLALREAARLEEEAKAASDEVKSAAAGG